MSRLLLDTFLLVASLVVASVSGDLAIGDTPHHPSPSIDRPPPIKGNPAFDPNLPVRIARPGRPLFRCARAEDGATAELYSSAVDFDEGRQSFFLKRRDRSGEEVLYPVHGFFLDGGASGIFMIHDGKSIKGRDAYTIDQSVNMGVLFLRTSKSTGEEPALHAILDVFAEDGEGKPGMARQSPVEYSCRWTEEGRRLNSQNNHVRAQANSGATPPSHWYGESDKTLLTCRAGEYRIELRVAKIWPGHLGFLVVRTPDQAQPVGYNVHMLEGPGRLLIHAHSYPHRTRTSILDTLEETETVIGGLLLVPARTGYTGWIGLAGASADPYNITFSREATVGDYATHGRIVVPPLPVICASPSS